MIRTKYTHIEKYDVCAYRQKFPAGGVGVVIVDKDGICNGIADICRKTGKPVNYKKYNENIPDELFIEATLATKNFPYHVLPTVVVSKTLSGCENISADKPHLKESIVARFDEFVSKFLDSDGNFSQRKLNQNFIQYASRNHVISSTINTDGCTVNAVIDFILETKAAEMARLILPFNGYTEALIDMLNEICGCIALDELCKVVKAKLNKVARNTNLSEKFYAVL